MGASKVGKGISDRPRRREARKGPWSLHKKKTGTIYGIDGRSSMGSKGGNFIPLTKMPERDRKKGGTVLVASICLHKKKALEGELEPKITGTDQKRIG